MSAPEQTTERNHHGDKSQSSNVEQLATATMQAEVVEHRRSAQGTGPKTPIAEGQVKGQNPHNSPAALEFDDPFKVASAGPETRSIKTGRQQSDAKHPAEQAPDHRAERAKTHGKTEQHHKASPPQPQTAGAEPPFSIVGRPASLDPSKPTVAVLDSFNGPTEKVSGLPLASHGEIIAKSNEANGFNVFRLETGSSNASFGDKLEAIENKVNSGELPLGKGDAINISLGPADAKIHQDLTVKQAGEFFGLPLTPENLAENKDKLLDKVREKAEATDDQGLKGGLNEILRSNGAIKRLQDKGINVIHAAGNEGPETFTIQFMNANTQLGSQKPDGEFDGFSATHSLLQKGADGVIGVTSQPPDAFSKTDLAHDKGSTELLLPGSKPISFPITGLGKGFLGPDKIPFDTADRNNIHSEPNKLELPEVSPTTLPTSLLSNEPLAAPESKFAPGAPKPDFAPGALKGPDVSNPFFIEAHEKTKNINDKVEFSDAPSPTDGTQKVAGAIAGSSFSNIRWLLEHKEEMERIKQGSR